MSGDGLVGRSGRVSALAALLATVFLAAMSAPVGAATVPAAFPHQSLGNRGVDVKAIQGFLRHHGAMMERVDGIFGDMDDVKCVTGSLTP